MSKSGNKPTLQVSLQSNLCHYLLCIQKRALEMVENSRDPNMSTKIQELSRQVTFTSLTIQVRSAISFSEHDLHRCLILLVHFKTGIACPLSPNRWYIYNHFFLHYRRCPMNDYHLGAHSTSSSTTPGAKLPPARNWGSIQDSSLLHRLLGLSRGFQINRLSSQSMASSCPQPCSARKVLEDSKRPR